MGPGQTHANKSLVFSKGSSMLELAATLEEEEKRLTIEDKINA